MRKVRGQVASANKEPAGGPHEGIKIHGHSVIDLRSPKGELVEHREFESSYVGHLPTILAGKFRSGGWETGLMGGTSTYYILAPVTGSGEVPPALDRLPPDCYQHRHCLSSTKSNRLLRCFSFSRSLCQSKKQF